MPQIAHNHDFAATNSGYACQLPNCSVAITNAEVASNLQTTTPGVSNKHVTLSDLLNQASKKSGKQ